MSAHLEATFARLSGLIEELRSGEDWQRLLSAARRFHRYSPTNQLLLAAQGAERLVASFKRWTTVPSVDGGMCQVRKGERALRVIAPIVVSTEADGELVRGFRASPVFHEGQLIAAPAVDGPQPVALTGGDVPVRAWDALVAEFTADGFRVERGQPSASPSAFGEVRFGERVVTIRADVDPAQVLKSLVHERAHTLLHAPTADPAGRSRSVFEVEAESVAFVVLDALGVDSSSYSIPYVTGWASGDVEVVRSTAERVLSTAQQIIRSMGERLGVELLPDPLARVETPAAVMALPVPSRSADEIVTEHLARGRLDWAVLFAALPGAERARQAASDDPATRVRFLAEAGTSVEVVRMVLTASEVAPSTIDTLLSAIGEDYLGEQPTTYSPAEIERSRSAHPSSKRVDSAERLLSTWRTVETRKTDRGHDVEALIDHWRSVEITVPIRPSFER